MNNNIKYFYNFISNKYLTILFLIFIIFYKNGFSNTFNGLPFSNKYETILYLIVIPIIFLFNSKIFLDKKFKYIIFFLFLIKMILISVQYTNGLAHKIYKPGNDNSEIILGNDNSEMIKSYSSFWFENISDIQESNWSIKKNFPLDWMNYDKSFGTSEGSSVDSTEKYKNIKLIDKIETYLIIDKKRNINFNFEGLSDNSILEINYDDKKTPKIINLTNGNNTIFFDRGKFKLKFTLYFQGKKWAINIIEENNFLQLSEYRYFSVNEPPISIRTVVLFIFIGIFYEIILISLIVYSLFLSLKDLTNKKNTFLFITHPLSIISSFYILNYFKIDDQTGFWTLSLSFIFVFLIYFLNLRLKLNKIETNLLFFSIFLTSSIYCTFIFYHNLETTFFWSAGDDWKIFHEKARSIVVDREWIRAGEDVYYFRPGIRYIFAYFHLIFGNPSFAIQFIDIWSILLMTYLVFLLFLKSNINTRIGFALSILIPIMLFGESFRWLIGRGLTEYFGSFILVLSSYLVYKKYLQINFNFILICLLIILTAWLREEKFVTAVCIILLSNHFIIKFNFFNDIVNFIINNFRLIFIYSALILFGFPILFIFRNYMYSDNLTALDNPAFLEFGYGSIYSIIMGVDPNKYPRLIGLINVPAVLISILTLFHFKFYKYFNNVGFPIIILMLILPTLIFEIPGYVPRHSIYLLPYTILINSIFLIKVYNSFTQK